MGIAEKKIVKINTNENEIDKLLIGLGFDENFIFQEN